MQYVDSEKYKLHEMLKNSTLFNRIRSNSLTVSENSLRYMDFDSIDTCIFVNEYGKIPFSYRLHQQDRFLHVDSENYDLFLFEPILNELLNTFREMKIVAINNRIYDNESVMVFELKPGVIFTIYDCLPKKIIDYKKDGLELPEEEVLCFDNFQLLYLPEQMEEMSSVLYILEKYKMKYTGHENIGVGIISYSNEMYHIKKITTPDKRKVCTELDLHYKPGFTAFYGNLVNKMKNDDKGLVLFYGPPGTGKTYCIRNLMNDLREDKYFVLVPPDIIRNILEPGFISFLTRYIIEHNEKKIVLICEDAENLLKDRKDNGSIGISNLLNMTDGILNDLLGFQVIATFNMDLVDLDKALLRTGRLLAQKEFTNLSVFEAEKLKEYLGVKGDTTGEMSLAEIYSLVTESGILRHNIRQNEGKKIGFV